MVRRYYHLHQEEAQKQMAKIDFMGGEQNGKIRVNAKVADKETAKKKAT
jgi:hypothetical protein